MREIVLDTETTGFDPNTGDRIVEIGAIELINHLPSGNTYHAYINPQREMPEGAFQIHGLTTDFLADKPLFSEIVDSFLEFIADDILVIHNAPFDMKFLNWELQQANRTELKFDRVIDTLEMSRKKFPGSPNNLNALCKRYKIDISNRDLHGALIDSQLLASVYLELIGGRQTVFSLTQKEDPKQPVQQQETNQLLSQRPVPLPSRLTDSDRLAHAKLLETLSGDIIWHQIDSQK